jgi:hypothetical protein
MDFSQQLLAQNSGQTGIDLFKTQAGAALASVNPQAAFTANGAGGGRVNPFTMQSGARLPEVFSLGQSVQSQLNGTPISDSLSPLVSSASDASSQIPSQVNQLVKQSQGLASQGQSLIQTGDGNIASGLASIALGQGEIATGQALLSNPFTAAAGAAIIAKGIQNVTSGNGLFKRGEGEKQDGVNRVSLGEQRGRQAQAMDQQGVQLANELEQRIQAIAGQGTDQGGTSAAPLNNNPDGNGSRFGQLLAGSFGKSGDNVFAAVPASAPAITSDGGVPAATAVPTAVV